MTGLGRRCGASSRRRTLLAATTTPFSIVPPEQGAHSAAVRIGKGTANFRQQTSDRVRRVGRLSVMVDSDRQQRLRVVRTKVARWLSGRARPRSRLPMKPGTFARCGQPGHGCRLRRHRRRRDAPPPCSQAVEDGGCRVTVAGTRRVSTPASSGPLIRYWPRDRYGVARRP
jgi:hypothetical protein